MVNYKNVDSIGTSAYDTNPVRQGQNSYEVWLQGHFTGTFSAIYDIRFWMSVDFSPNTGLTVRFKSTQQTYAQPSSANSSIATTVVPTSDPGSANVSLAGSLTSSLTTSGYTDYIVLQLQTTVAATGGDTSISVYTMSYLET